MPLIEQVNVMFRDGRSGVRFPTGQLISSPKRLRRPLSLIQWVPWVGCPGLKQAGHEADSYLSLQMNGVVPLLRFIPSSCA